MSQDNVEVVRRVIAYLNETGAAGPLELFDPDVTFTTRGELGGGETFTGREGIRRAVAMFGEVWAKTTAHVVDLIEGDNVVVAVLRMELRSHAGVDLEVEEAWAYRLRDDKIARVEQHGKREDALDAAGLSP
jgi:ketosteroid isomerase-like protein